MMIEEWIPRMHQLEEEYYEEFCERTDDQGVSRYQDDLIHDMYSHNFTLIREPLAKDELASFIEREIERRKQGGKDFLMLKFPVAVDHTDIPERYRDGATDIEYYRLPLVVVQRLPEREDLEIIRVSELLLDEAAELDELCEEGESLDFTQRRFQRRSQVYLSDSGPDQYLALLDWEAVGSCDFYSNGTTCTLEDFTVDPEYRRQGIGTSLLKSLALRAYHQGCDLVFLTADTKETAREMYRKLGFEKMTESTELLIKF